MKRILLESKLLETLARDLLRGFLLSEEAYFEEMGKRKPYTARVEMSKSAGIDWASVTIEMLTAQGNREGFTAAALRLPRYAEEFLEDHVFDIKLGLDRTIGSASLRMRMPE